MKVLEVKYRRFRGFKALTIRPRGHVLLIGPARAGKSDVLEGLSRVLGAGRGRLEEPDELDFYDAETDTRAEVEVVVGDLGTALEQLFYDQLEFWDIEAQELVDEFESADELDNENVVAVVRLCYRIEWDDAEAQPRHWVDFPKSSDPDAGIFRRLSRGEREALPFVGWSASGRVLGLAPRASFRELVNERPGDGLQDALDELFETLEAAGSALASVDQVAQALDAVLDPWRGVLQVGDQAAKDMIRFLPEGGAIAGILRALSPAIDLPDAPDSLPLSRHGTTTHALFFHGQLIARAAAGSVVAIDEFGDRLDGAAALHSADLLRQRSQQVWLATRLPHVAEAFRPDEIVRLARDSTGRRRPYHGSIPATKPERLAARHMNTQLLPALAAEAVCIVEGPHDRRALDALTRKLAAEERVQGLAAHRIALLDAGAAEGAGGTGAAVRLADAATDLGFRAVIVLDFDRAEQAAAELRAADAVADAVIRLPEGFAIERVLCEGLDDEVMADALEVLQEGFGIALLDAPADLTGKELRSLVVKILKQSGGLHAEFINALGPGQTPPLGRALLEAAVAAGSGQASGVIQL